MSPGRLARSRAATVLAFVVRRRNGRVLLARARRGARGARQRRALARAAHLHGSELAARPHARPPHAVRARRAALHHLPRAHPPNARGRRDALPRRRGLRRERPGARGTAPPHPRAAGRLEVPSGGSGSPPLGHGKTVLSSADFESTLDRCGHAEIRIASSSITTSRSSGAGSQESRSRSALHARLDVSTALREFLAETLSGHNELPTRQLVFSPIGNPPTIDTYKKGGDPATSVLGITGTGALEHLGIEPVAYRWQMMWGKVSIVIDTRKP